MADEKQPNLENEAGITEEVAQKPVQPETIMSPSFTAYYANSVRLLATQWDVRLLFGQIGPSKDGREDALVNEQLVSISMSYEHAKALAIILGQNIRSREKAFGPIFLKPKDQGMPSKS